MGAMTSMFVWPQKYSKNPDDYWVHGIHYWPGEAVPFTKWKQLLPDYVPECMNHGKDHKQTPCGRRVKFKRHRTKETIEMCDEREVNEQSEMRRGQCVETARQVGSAKNVNERGVEFQDCKKTEDTNDHTNCNTSLFDDLPSQPKNTSLFDDLPEWQSEQFERMQVPTEERWKTVDYPFENLVLSGGGMKGYAYIGAVKALEDAGLMAKMKRFAGTSAGAMCSSALSLGYSAQDIARFFFVNLREAFNDQTCAPVCCFPKLYKQFGIHPGKNLLEGFGLMIAAKTGGNTELTFEQHHEQFGKELCIVVSNITKMTTEYCHYTTTPDLTIKEAVRMSMSVPFVYEPAKRKVDGKMNYYIDGSAGDHFPIHVFDGPSVGPNFKQPVNPKTIGFYALNEIDSAHLTWINTFGKEIPNKPLYMPHTTLARVKLKKQIKKRKRQHKDFDEKTYVKQLETLSQISPEERAMKHYEAPRKTHVDTRNVLKYLIASMRLFLCSQVTCKLRPEDEARTIPINVGYVEGNDYGIEPPDREFMIKQGYASASSFLQQYDARQTEQ